MSIIETKRLELHEFLVSILGSKNVYYQPPETIKMSYPAIVYSRDDIDNRSADNSVYMQFNVYEITVIDKDPDSIVVEKLSMLPMSRFERHYVANNLNHDIFRLYY